MKTIIIKNLNDLEEEEVNYVEQDVEFKIGVEGDTYEITLEREDGGNISDIPGWSWRLLDYPVGDIQACIIHKFLNDAYIMYDIDQKMYDTDVDECFIHYVDVDEFIKNNFFDDEEMEFIKEQEDEEGYMRIYVTVTENRVLEEE